MIRFEQTGDGTPKDILVTTDDSQGELGDWEDMLTDEFADSQAMQHLDAARAGEDGLTRFIVPGDEAGEIADLHNDLADFIEECNRKMLEQAEANE